MAIPVLMPKQGQSVESCIITEWYKSAGDRVRSGDLLFAYETDKASFEEEAPGDGILLELFFQAGDEVPVLTNVAVIGEEGEPTQPFRPGNHPPTGEKSVPGITEMNTEDNAGTAAATIQPGESTPARGGRGGRIIISPRARKLAEAQHMAYETLAGSGPNGRIIVRDVEKALAGRPAPAPATGAGAATGAVAGYTDRPLSNVRKRIAKSMHASLQNTAQLTHHMGADARNILQLRKKFKAMQKEGFAYNITLNDMVCYAAIRALGKNPEANAHFLDDTIRVFSKVHLGLAVDTERGLMVPVLTDASDLSLEGLSSRLKSLADSCRSGKIDPDLLAATAASFTLSNLGNYGVEMFTPIINPPQVAILGVNTIVHRPAMLTDGTYGFVPYIGLSLTYDHRAIDGGPATKFLADIKNEIENLKY